MAKKALCVGINDYPGTRNDLSGCVNDANDWAGVLSGRGFDVTSLLDAKATKANMVAAIRGLISGAGQGDSLVFTYSGHGTFLPDTSGDEPDGYDEALCPYDIGQGNALLDDEIHELFAARQSGVRIALISDSCHSGTVIRWAEPDTDADAPRARFLPPSAWMPESRLPRNATGEIPTRISARPRNSPLAAALLSGGGDVLIAGCQDNEYSYDAQFKGRPNGALTFYAQKTLSALPATASYADWLKAIRAYLPSANYPQTPQIMGSKRARAFRVLN